MTKKIFFTCLLSMFAWAGIAQVLEPTSPDYRRDGLYNKENAINKRFIPYTSLREADVMWTNRIWRAIDLREKLNQTLYYPLDVIQDRKSLFQVIIDATYTTGEVLAFSSADDEFRVKLTKSELESKLVRYDTLQVEDPTTGEMKPQAVKNELTSRDIIMYRIKEDWFFDKQRSVMDVRILGIHPIYMKRNDKGEEVAPAALFWIYFPEIRPIFARSEVYNRTVGDAERRTLDDIFWKRMFSSYIYQQTNVYNRSINDYNGGTESLKTLMESERIKEKIFTYEHDMWHF